MDAIRAIEIPTFVDPNLFWIIAKDHISGLRTKIDEELNRKCEITSKVEPVVKQVVCVNHLSKWKRAVVKEIQKRNHIICWLIDYGEECTVSQVFAQPDEVKGFRPIAKRASLWNVTALKHTIVGSLEVQFKPSLTYQLGDIKQCIKHIKNAQNIYFYPERIYENVTCGYIKLQNGPNLTYNLVDVLICEKSISIDPDMYKETFQINKPGFPLTFLKALDNLDPKNELEFISKIYSTEEINSDSDIPASRRFGRRDIFLSSKTMPLARKSKQDVSSDSEFDKDKNEERHKMEIEKFRQRRRKHKKSGSPEISSSEIRSPEIRSPEIRSPEVKSPEVKSPEANSLELSSSVIDSSIEGAPRREISASEVHKRLKESLKKRSLNENSDLPQRTSDFSEKNSNLSEKNSDLSQNTSDLSRKISDSSGKNPNYDNWSDEEEESKGSATAGVVTFRKYGLDLNVKDVGVPAKQENDRRLSHNEWGSSSNSEPEKSDGTKKSDGIEKSISEGLSKLKLVEVKPRERIGGRGKRFLANRDCKEELFSSNISESSSKNEPCRSGRSLTKETIKHEVSSKEPTKLSSKGDRIQKNIPPNDENTDIWEDTKSTDRSNKAPFPPAELRPIPQSQTGNLSDLWTNMETSDNSDEMIRSSEKCKFTRGVNKLRHTDIIDLRAGGSQPTGPKAPNLSIPDKDIWSDVKSGDGANKISFPPAGYIPKPRKAGSTKSNRGSTGGSRGSKQRPFRDNASSASVSSFTQNRQDDTDHSDSFSTSGSIPLSSGKLPSQSSVSSSEEDKGQSAEQECKLGCKCSQCVLWSTWDMKPREELEFLDRPKKTVVKRDVVKPALLFKTEEGSKPTGNIYSLRDNLNVSKILYSNVLAHGNPIPNPIELITSVPFEPQVQHVLSCLKFRTVKPLQSCVWPVIMRNQSVLMVGGQESGKTMCYVPAIFSYLLDRANRYKQLPVQERGPIAVVICSSSLQAEEVYEKFSLFHPRMHHIRISMVVAPVEKYKLDFNRPCDILITTPMSLVSLVSNQTINFKRLCHLIIENTDTNLDKYRDEMENILKLTQSMLSNRICRYTVQLIVASETWTIPIDSLMRDLLHLPLVCIFHPLEAAVYGRTHFQPHFLEQSHKVDQLKEIIKEKYMLYKTIVMCNSTEETEFIKERLAVDGIPMVLANGDMSIEQLIETESTWEIAVGGKRIVLVCTEDAFTSNFSITGAHLLIHYSLPKDSWSCFKRRFQCLLDNQHSPLLPTDLTDLKAKTHIFIDETCVQQFPRLAHFMQRLGMKFPEKYSKLCQGYITSYENKKISDNVMLCNKLKVFGKCSRIKCGNRHIVSPKIDSNNYLPRSGKINFKILNVEDVTLYTIKLLEHVDGKGKCHQIQDDSKFIRTKLKRCLAKVKEFADDVKVNDVFAYPVDNMEFERVKVLRILSREKITKKARQLRVKYLESGEKKVVSAVDLYQIPDELKTIRPQGICVHLANCVPLEKDEQFSMRSLATFKKILTEKDYTGSTSHFSADIALQVGNEIWIDNLCLMEDLEVSNLVVTKLDVKQSMLSKKIVCEDKEPLKRLYEICKEGGLELPDYSYLNVEKEVVSRDPKNMATPQWAFLDVEDYVPVHLVGASTPSHFYVRLQKFDDLFNMLQQEMQNAIMKPLYPKISRIEKGRYCLANFNRKNMYFRAVVTAVHDDDTVECFYVDTGDVSREFKCDLRYLSDDYIRQLPFQAIECSLYGVMPYCDSYWSEEALNMFLHFRFEPNNNYFRDLFAKVVFVDGADVTGGQKYCIVLIDTFKKRTLINEHLINEKVAETVEKEDINEVVQNVDDVELPDIGEPLDSDDYTASDPEDQKEPTMTFQEFIDDAEREVENVISQRMEEVAKHNGNVQESEKNKMKRLFNVDLDDLDRWEMCGNMLANTTLTIAEQDDRRVLISRDTLAIAEDPQGPEPSTSGAFKKYTPKVVWRQTDELLKIDIQLPVERPNVQIVRNRKLFFQATYDDRQYVLNLNLYEKVKASIQMIEGQTVRLTLTKQAKGEWPRLISEKTKRRNIHLDVASTIKPEKKRLFLQLDDDFSVKKNREKAESSGDEFLNEFYSDEDYDESDAERYSG